MVEQILAATRMTAPFDLIDFWIATGGGDFFESETILGPIGDDRLGDSVRVANSVHSERGMPSRYLLFRTGVGLGAIDQQTGRYVELSPAYYPIGSFETFNEWYCDIRRDFAETYGLAELPGTG